VRAPGNYYERWASVTGAIPSRRTARTVLRKKTAFAMALLPNPEALFLDEPFEAIDPVTSKNHARPAGDDRGRGVTVFLTSHILSVVERIASQFVMIRAGKMVWNSRAEELNAAARGLYFDWRKSRSARI